MTRIMTSFTFLPDQQGWKWDEVDLEPIVEAICNRIIDERLTRFPVPRHPQPTYDDAKSIAW